MTKRPHRRVEPLRRPYSVPFSTPLTPRVHAPAAVGVTVNTLALVGGRTGDRLPGPGGGLDLHGLSAVGAGVVVVDLADEGQRVRGFRGVGGAG